VALLGGTQDLTRSKNAKQKKSSVFSGKGGFRFHKNDMTNESGLNFFQEAENDMPAS
jgi:hypothetical protein